MSASPAPALLGPAAETRDRQTPYLLLALVGLGGLFSGITGSLVSAFIPPLVQDVLGDRRTAIGAMMTIDNVLLILLVPLAGAASDRSARGRIPLVACGLMVASLGMAVMPWAGAAGLAGLVAALVVLHTGTNLPRAPFQALLADAVPSHFRPLAAGSTTFQMCVGAIAFLMLGQIFGMRTAFLAAAMTVLFVNVAIVARLRDRSSPAAQESNPSYRSLAGAVWEVIAGAVPGLRAVFVASFLLQLTFQTFTTWYSLHGTERFGVGPEQVTTGFIAWAMGGVIGALPAGAIGVRIGRRPTMLLGFALMTVALIALDRVGSMALSTPLLALTSAFWTFPMANAFALFVEPIPRQHRGVLAALFLLSMALGGAVGDPLNGALFDLFGGYRPLFLMMSAYTVLAFAAVLRVPRGAGEADTGPDRAGPRAPQHKASLLDDDLRVRPRVLFARVDVGARSIERHRGDACRIDRASGP
jgi:MFS family permease